MLAMVLLASLFSVAGLTVRAVEGNDAGGIRLPDLDFGDPTEGTTQPTEGTTQPTEDTTQPTEGTTQPTESTTQPTEGATGPEEGTTKPTGGVTKPADKAPESVEGTTEGTQEVNTKPVDQTTVATESAAEAGVTDQIANSKNDGRSALQSILIAAAAAVVIAVGAVLFILKRKV